MKPVLTIDIPQSEEPDHQQFQQLEDKTKQDQHFSFDIEQLLCIHQQQPSFICRDQNCLKNNKYLVCSTQCMQQHFQHPQNLISYQIFTKSLPYLKKTYSNLQIKNAVKIRQNLNRLLHIRVSITQCINTQVQVLKKMLTPIQFPCIKDCIYLIDSFNLKNQQIIYNTEDQQKQIDHFLAKSVSRLNRNIQQITKKGFEIIEYENQDKNASKVFSSISIELRIQNIRRHLSTPLKIKNNTKACIKNKNLFKLRYVLLIFIIVMGSNPSFKFSLRNYQESYERLLKGLKQIDWINRIHLVVWDNFLGSQNKLGMIENWKNDNQKIKQLIVEDKLKSLIYNF